MEGSDSYQRDVWTGNSCVLYNYRALEPRNTAAEHCKVVVAPIRMPLSRSQRRAIPLPEMYRSQHP
jgi:hypothetical protein